MLGARSTAPNGRKSGANEALKRGEMNLAASHSLDGVSSPTTRLPTYRRPVLKKREAHIRGGLMPSRPFPLVFAAALLWPAAAWSQQPPSNFPDGPGKQTVLATCGGCHDINRLRAGYTPAGWNMIQHMMQNMAAPIAPEEWPTVITYLMKSFPERPRPAAAMIAGPVQATHQAVGRSDHRFAPARPARDQRRRDLVVRTAFQQARQGRSQDRRDQGIQPQDAIQRAPWPDRGQRRQHLVHRQHRRVHRQARSENRTCDRIQNAGPGGQRSAHVWCSITTAFCGSRCSRPT